MNSEAARLSRLLWEVREELDAWALVVTTRTGIRPRQIEELISEIDVYRAERGWSPDGYGGESA